MEVAARATHKVIGRAAALLLLLAIVPGTAAAQSYPSRVVRIVVGSPPGGVVDVMGRPIAQRLTEAFGTQVIVDNRVGATGLIANDLVAKAPPDGHMLLLTPGSFVVISPHLNPKAAHGSLADFAPVTQICAFHYVLAVHPSVPAKTVREFIAFARAKPGLLTFASSGAGSSFHLAGELFKISTGIDMLHVPYKGSPPAVIDLISGRADAMFISLAVVQQHIKSGRLRALGVTGSKRDPLFPDVPTIAESGVPGYEAGGWFGFLAPAGTPKEIVDRLNAAIVKILGTAEMRDLFTAQGMEVITSTPEQFGAKMREDYAKFGKLIKAASIKPE